MKARPKKSRSLSLVGGSVREIHFKIGGDTIPTVREKLVKSLRCLYSIPLTDHHRGTEVQKVVMKGLKSIDKTCLPGKMKAWCKQHGLLPGLLWPLQMYENALSHVERIQQYSNRYLRKWLDVPPCFSKAGLYPNSGNMQLPISSLVEELEIGKVRLYMMMKDSADGVIRKAYPEIKSRTKWSAVKNAECSLRIKDITGVTQTNRARLVSTSNKVFSKVGPKRKRDNGERRGQDVQRGVKTSHYCYSGQKKCAWTKWNDIKPIKLSWKSLNAMEPPAISFLLRSTYDLLPNATNLKLWAYNDSDLCFSCKNYRSNLAPCTIGMSTITSDVHVAT